MELYGESYSRFFDVPEGTIGALADIYAEGDTAMLENFILYPVDHEELKIGVRKLLAIRREIEMELRQLGFTRLRITGMRLTGASPRRDVNVRRRLV